MSSVNTGDFSDEEDTPISIGGPKENEESDMEEGVVDGCVVDGKAFMDKDRIQVNSVLINSN